jgi:hypothetical protein
VLRFVYYHTFVANVQYLRDRFGIKKGITPGTFVGLNATAFALVHIMLLAGIIMLSIAFEIVETSDGGVDFIWDSERAAIALALLGGGIVVYGFLRSVAYYMLQRDINAIWAAYHRRSATLAPAAPAGPVAPQQWLPA